MIVTFSDQIEAIFTPCLKQIAEIMEGQIESARAKGIRVDVSSSCSCRIFGVNIDYFLRKLSSLAVLPVLRLFEVIWSGTFECFRLELASMWIGLFERTSELFPY